MKTRNIKIFSVLLLSSSLLGLSSNHAFSADFSTLLLQFKNTQATTQISDQSTSSQNPFAALFGKGNATPASTPSAPQTTPAQNPFAALFGNGNATPVSTLSAPQAAPAQNPFTALFGNGNATPVSTLSAPQAAPAQNPFAALFGNVNVTPASTSNALQAAPAQNPFAALFGNVNATPASTSNAPQAAPAQNPFAAHNVNPLPVSAPSVSQPVPSAIQSTFFKTLVSNQSNVSRQNSEDLGYIGNPKFLKGSGRIVFIGNKIDLGNSVLQGEVYVSSNPLTQAPSTSINTFLEKFKVNNNKDLWLSLNNEQRTSLILSTIINDNFKFSINGVVANQTQRNDYKKEFINKYLDILKNYKLDITNDFDKFINNFQTYLTPILNQFNIDVGQDKTRNLQRIEVKAVGLTKERGEKIYSGLKETIKLLTSNTGDDLLNRFHIYFPHKLWANKNDYANSSLIVNYLFNNDQIKPLHNLSITFSELDSILENVIKIARNNNIMFPNNLDDLCDNFTFYTRPVLKSFDINEDRLS